MSIQKLSNLRMPLPKDAVDAEIEIGFIQLEQLAKLGFELLEIS